MKTKLKEVAVQKALTDYYKDLGYEVTREVKTPVGIIDLLMHDMIGRKILVEVKELKSIKHAIGQLQSYKIFHPDAVFMKAIYFSYDFKHRNLSSGFSNLNVPNLTFESAHLLLPIDRLHKYNK